MRTLSAILILFLHSSLFAQISQRPHSNSVRSENSIGQHHIIDISVGKRKFRPQLSLQQALKIAEKYIVKEKLDVSSRYLYQAKFIMFGGEKNQQPSWMFWWINETGAAGEDIQIIVSIKTKSAGRVPSM